jgi:hypothetical protein
VQPSSNAAGIKARSFTAPRRAGVLADSVG